MLLSVIGTVAIILLGVSMLVRPRGVWYLTQGWWAYDNSGQVRLSDTYLALNIINAVAVILAGVIGLVLSIRQV